MKKIVVVFVCIFMMLGVLPDTVFATIVIDSGKCGKNVTWEFTSDGVLTISGKGDMYEYHDEPGWNEYIVKSVVIEDGVTGIGECSFMYCQMESIVISDSVTSIGHNAFYICPNLKSIEIPAGVTYIGERIIWGCSSLEHIWVDEENQHYCSDEQGVLYNKEMTELLEVPRGLSGDYRIADGVINIWEYLFIRPIGLETLTIPASVKFIDELAFDGCFGLTKIIVDEDNPYYSSDENGFLYNKDKTELVYVPGGITGEITIPPSVTAIQHWAFWDLNEVHTIRFTGNAPYAKSEHGGSIGFLASKAYYPADNPTWTVEAMEELGSGVVWIAYYPEIDTEDKDDSETSGDITDNTESGAEGESGDGDGSTTVDTNTEENTENTEGTENTENTDRTESKQEEKQEDKKEEIKKEENKQETEALKMPESAPIAAEQLNVTTETVVDNIEDTPVEVPENADEEPSGIEIQAIVVSVLRGIGIGIACVAVVIGASYAVNLICKKAKKKGKKE